MAYTSFGELIRELRIEYHESLGDIADILGVSLPCFSSVLHGKRNIPSAWLERIIEHFKLTDAEQQKIIEAAEESRTQFKIVTKNAGNLQRKAALHFTKSFNEMDDETALKILELLTRKGEHGNETDYRTK